MLKKRKVLIVLLMTICFVVVGFGATYAMKHFTKQDEIVLKEQLKVDTPIGERAIDMIGVFPPQFEDDAAYHLAMYEKEYGQEAVQFITYNGYTLIIPPNKISDEINKVKDDIDHNIQSRQKETPSLDIQAKNISEIRDVFGVQENIVYDFIIGAYVDDRGYQYNFYNDTLVSKQIGITSTLQQKWKESYPYLVDLSITKSSIISEEEVKAGANAIITKLFDGDKASKLKTEVKLSFIDGYRVLIIYGDNEVRFLVDKASGDIIYYGKIK